MKKLSFVVVCVIAFVFLISAIFTIKNNITLQSGSASIQRAYPTVVLDAGHGGEDGGAVATDGTVEKDINLNISNGIAAYFELFGVPYIPVRTCDRSVCDEGLTSVRERKRSDIMNRYALVQNTENALLLSIHQNMFGEQKYSGAQIFYAPGDEASQKLAGCIRSSVYGALQPENKRELMPSADSIYLLYRAKKPSVMVECGFLSNPEELAKLKSPEYDSQMGYFVFRGIMNFINSN